MGYRDRTMYLKNFWQSWTLGTGTFSILANFKDFGD